MNSDRLDFWFVPHVYYFLENLVRLPLSDLSHQIFVSCRFSSLGAHVIKSNDASTPSTSFYCFHLPLSFGVLIKWRCVSFTISLSLCFSSIQKLWSLIVPISTESHSDSNCSQIINLFLRFYHVWQLFILPSDGWSATISHIRWCVLEKEEEESEEGEVM